MSHLPSFHAGPYPAADPTCPYCGRVMVTARKYNVWNEALPLALDDVHSAPVFLSADFVVLAALWRLWVCALSRLATFHKARRLRRLLQDYPGSLICPNCGVLRRRVADEA